MKSAIRASLSACCIFSCAAAADGPAHSEMSAVIVQGTLNHVPAQFLVDTGADRSGIASSRQRSLGLRLVGKMEVISLSGTLVVPVCESISLSLNDFPLGSAMPWVLDSEGNNALRLLNLDANIGLDVLSHHVVVVSGRQIGISEHAPQNIEVVSKVMTSNSAGRVVELPVQIHGVEQISVRIDTGSNDTCRLSKERCARLKSSGQILPGLTRRTIDVRGVADGSSYILRSLTIAGVTFKNVPITFGNDDAIGLELLRHLNLVLDFPQHQILIGKPPKDVIDRFPQNASGMAILFDEEDALKVMAVRPDSAAEENGINVGDVVVLLDGKSPSELSIDDVKEILAQNGQTILIRFRRDGREFTIDLPLELPFEYPPDWSRLDKPVEDFEQFLREQEESEKKTGSSTKP